MTGYLSIDFQDGNFYLKGDFNSRRNRHCRHQENTFFDNPCRNYFNDDFMYMRREQHDYHNNNFHNHSHHNPFMSNNRDSLDNSDLSRLFLNNPSYDELKGFGYQPPLNYGCQEPQYDYEPDCGCNKHKPKVEEDSPDCGCDESVENETDNTNQPQSSDADESTNQTQNSNQSENSNGVEEDTSNQVDNEEESDDNSVDNNCNNQLRKWSYPYYDNSDLDNLFKREYLGDPLDNSDLARLFDRGLGGNDYNYSGSNNNSGTTRNSSNSTFTDDGSYKRLRVTCDDGRVLKIKADYRFKLRDGDFDIDSFGAPFDTNTNYYDGVGYLEGRVQGYQSDNGEGYIGKYQFGDDALVDVGLKEKFYVTVNGHRKAKYKWKGVQGIWSDQDFKDRPDVQEKAMRVFTQQNSNDLKSAGAYKYLGQTINGIKITQAGLLAARHLGGLDAVMLFLRSNGQYVRHDGKGTPITKYMHKLSQVHTFN